MPVFTEKEYLEHFGVLGMKWGVHREAQRDAKEFGKAKMYYGEGAGVRRRLINNTIAAKSRKDPVYKQAVEAAITNVDYAKAASQARTKRAVVDTGNTTKRTVKKVAKVIGPIAAVAATAYYYANKDKIDRVIVKTSKDTYWSALRKAKMADATVKNFLHNQGIG